MTICPLYQTDNKDRLSELKLMFEKVAYKRASHHKIFDYTHYKIRAHMDDVEVEERDIYKAINPDIDQSGIRNMMIKGQTGVGKSELCAYLKKELAKDGLENHCLYLTKSVTLQELIVDILPKFYKKLTGKDLEGIDVEKFNEFKKYSGALADYLMLPFASELPHKLKDIILYDDEVRRGLAEFLKGKVNLIFINEEDATDISGLDPFNEMALNNEKNRIWAKPIKGFYNAKGKTSNYMLKELNEAYSEAIINCTSTKSFSYLLKHIAKEVGERIWVIFEDYKLGTADNRKLLDVATDDSTEYSIQFVIALVPSRLEHYKSMLGSTFEKRTNFVEFKEGKDNFVNAETCIEFISPFIKYHKHHNNDICTNCGKCPDEYKDLFPFNYTFLEKVFLGLDEKDQKAREYIDMVGSFLNKFACEEIAPFECINILSKIMMPGAGLEVTKGFPALKQRYFSDGDYDNKELEWFCDIFSIEIDKIEEEEGVVNKIEVIESSKDPQYDKLTNMIGNYLYDPEASDWAECRDYIELGYKLAIEELTDGFRVGKRWAQLQEPNIIYHIDKNNVLESKQKKTGIVGFHYEPKKFTHNVALEFFNIGYKKKKIYEGEIKEGISLEAYQFLNPILNLWRKRVKDNYMSKPYFNDLTLYCFNLLRYIKDPFMINEVNEYNEKILINKDKIGPITTEIYKLIRYDSEIEEILKWIHSTGGHFYLENQVFIDPWKINVKFKTPEIKRSYSEKRLRIKSNSVTEILLNYYLLSDMLKESSNEIMEKDEISAIGKLVESICSIKDEELFLTAANVNQLNGLSLRNHLIKLSEQDIQNILTLKKKIKIYEKETENPKLLLYTINLCQNELFSLVRAIANNESFKSLCNTYSMKNYDLIGLCNSLIQESTASSEKEKEEDIKKMKNKLSKQEKLLKAMMNQNLIQSFKFKEVKDVLEEMKTVESTYDKKVDKYFEDEQENLNLLIDVNSKLDLIDKKVPKILSEKLDNIKANPQMEEIIKFDKEKKTIQKEFEKNIPIKDKNKLLKLLRSERVPLNELTNEEMKEIIENKKLRKLFSIVFGS